MQSWIVSILLPVFSVTWSSEISLIYWSAAQNISYYYQSCKQLFNILWKQRSFQDSLSKKLKRHLFEIEIFCNISISLLSLYESIHFFKKPTILISSVLKGPAGVMHTSTCTLTQPWSLSWSVIMLTSWLEQSLASSALLSFISSIATSIGFSSKCFSPTTSMRFFT